MVEAVVHGFAGLKHQAGKSRVFETFGLDHFQDAQLHVPAGQPLGVIRRAGHGCSHDLLIGHIGDALSLSLFSGHAFLLFIVLLGFRRFVRLLSIWQVLRSGSLLQLFAGLCLLGSLRQCAGFLRWFRLCFQRERLHRFRLLPHHQVNL